MTLRNFDALILNAKGNPMMFDDEASKISMKQVEMICNCLGNGPLIDGRPENVSGDQKRKMFNLANKMSAGGDIDISVDEAALISRCVAHLPPQIWGQVDDALNRDLPPKG